MFQATLVPLAALVALVFGADAGRAWAQSFDSVAATRTLQATRAVGEIRMDGRLDEPVWEQAPNATDFTQNRPDPGTPATERTEVRVLYADEAIYVGARLYDNPDSIAAQLARRDGIGAYSDWIFVLLDSYNDYRTAFNFGVNPRGVKVDLLLTDDSRQDFSWDAVWEAATQIDSAGWTAEFRIPLSQLRYNPEQTVWGVNFQRLIARKNESALWSPTPPDAAGIVSRFGKLVGLDGLASPTRLELEPYSVARVRRSPPAAPGDPFHRKNDLFGSAGLDFQYGVTSSLTLTGTVNPDFGQVEADPSVVNLTAFESFFPEQRPFFVEGSNLFDFDVGGGRLFYSRRIGRRPQGFAPGDALFRDIPESSTILGAAKLSGRTASGWSIGVLDAVTAAEEARYVDAEGLERRAPVEPLTNYGVVRVSRDFRRGQSALGGIVTSTNRRLEDGGSLGFLRTSAYSGGVDGRHRFGGGNYEVRGSLVGSRIGGSTESIGLVQQAPGRYFQRPDAEHLNFDPGRTSLSGLAGNLFIGKIGGGRWGWGFLGNAVSPGFEVNDLGFQRQADDLNGRAYITLTQYEPNRLFRRSGIGLHTFGGWTFGGERVQTGFNTNGFFQLRNYWEGFFDITPTLSALSTNMLRGGPAVLEPAGLSFGGGLNTDRRKALSGRFFVRSLADGAGKRSLSLSPSLEVRPSPRMEFSAGPSISWNHDPAQYVGQPRVADTTFYLAGHLEQTTTSLVARLNYTFTPGLSLQFYAQPFISAGAYDRFRELGDPQAGALDERFRLFSEGELRACEGFYGVRAQRDGCGEDAGFAYRFGEPDFNTKRFNSNAVLRWEYRPGSTLFVVWNQGRRDFRTDGSFALDRDAGRLFAADGTNVLLVKLSYWFGL